MMMFELQDAGVGRMRLPFLCLIFYFLSVLQIMNAIRCIA